MALEYDGNELVLRASGIGRFFAAGFLAVWLCGWLAGECAALAGLGFGAWKVWTEPEVLQLPTGALAAFGAMGLFLLLWLTFWTYGGIHAMRELARHLWGVDRFRVSGNRLIIVSRGLGTQTRDLDASEFEHLELHHKSGALFAERKGTGKDEQLTMLGSREEREELRRELQRRLGLRHRAPLAHDSGDDTEGSLATDR